MKLERPIFTGCGTAIITPFKNDKVDYESFGKMIDWQILSGIDALIVCGTTGEAATLTDDEHRDVVEFAVKRAAGRVPVIAGTGSNDTAYAIDLSKHACEVGADALLHVTPYYNKASQLGLVKHFEKIADECSKPIILYNVPSRTGVSMSIGAYKALAEHPNIVATKEACGNLSFIVNLMEQVGDKLDVYSGNDDQIIPMMSVGACGVISVLSNVMPKETVEMTHLYLDGKCKEAAAMQLKYLELINKLFMTVNPIPVKTAMAMMGWCDVDMRLPLCEMEEQENAILANVLKEYNLI